MRTTFAGTASDTALGAGDNVGFVPIGNVCLDMTGRSVHERGRLLLQHSISARYLERLCATIFG